MQFFMLIPNIMFISNKNGLLIVKISKYSLKRGKIDAKIGYNFPMQGNFRSLAQTVKDRQIVQFVALSKVQFLANFDGWSPLL